MGASERRIALLLPACVWSFAAGAAASFNLSEPEPGLFVHIGRQLALDVPGHDDIANIGFIVGARCVAVIDTGGSVRIGRELRAAVTGRSSLPICYVINTHAHVDHVLGNAAFTIDRPSFVGSAALRAAMDRSREFFVREYAADLDAPANSSEVIGPDRPVDAELVLDLGDRPLVLHAWPTAHSDCDLTVFDVRTRTLWTGDLLFRERLPALDGSLRGWLAALRQLKEMQVNFTVPGHGAATHDLGKAVELERRYLQAVSDGVRSEIAHNGSVEDAIARVAVAQKPRWLLWDQVHPRNIIRAYEQIEWE
jgi:quinoprotein relay system zinc metallohydrolase 2